LFSIEELLLRSSSRQLHHFACGCAEHALGYLDNPPEQCTHLLSCKRQWLEGLLPTSTLKSAYWELHHRYERMDSAKLCVTSCLRASSWEVEEDSLEEVRYRMQDAARCAAAFVGFHLARQHRSAAESSKALMNSDPDVKEYRALEVQWQTTYFNELFADDSL